MIEVVIGAGGLGGPTMNNAGNGMAGRAELTWSGVVDVPADVVPLIPTASGTFSRNAGQAGSFPNLGAGLWVIDSGTSWAAMYLDEVTISPGHVVNMGGHPFRTFVSSQTPTFTNVGAGSRTIHYKFYSMGSWG